MDDLAVFWLVVSGRFLLPLFIPIFPLPAIILCMILDGVDQTIFQKFTNLPLDGYQGYDKALDIYYLSIAYLSTMRNWENINGFKISRFLFYFRMVGDMLFQLTSIRALLLIFPNTFEYFFDFYEAVRLRWNPKKMKLNFLIFVAAFIWIFIKLPQEWWIHVAQLDMTDFLSAHPPLIVMLGILILASPFILKFALNRLPKAERKLNFRVVPEIKPVKITRWNDGLIEKLIFVSLISIIFAQILPNLKTTNLQLIIGVVIVIAINSFIVRPRFSTPINFVLTAGMNLVLGTIYIWILGRSVDPSALLFFSLMLGVLVAFYDSYLPFYKARVN